LKNDFSPAIVDEIFVFFDVARISREIKKQYFSCFSEEKNIRVVLTAGLSFFSRFGFSENFDLAARQY
jgi:hypothetical protein